MDIKEYSKSLKSPSLDYSEEGFTQGSSYYKQATKATLALSSS
jgi:hypothetical protein